MSAYVTPTIVVLAYERAGALQRLFASLERASYPAGEEVSLIISLDRSDTPEGQRTASTAAEFAWRHGPKRIISRPEHLGVVGHFRAVGELSREYGAIILLEDDLTVSPALFDCARQLLEAYGQDNRIAGFCLYGLWFNGFTHEPFQPLQDGGDVFFLRVPYTQGLCFTAEQWSAFEAWWGTDGQVREHPELHRAFQDFGRDEWFPALASYLAHTGRFFCFPRASLTTGWGDAGAHFDTSSSWFQTPLLMGPARLRLPSLDDAAAVYDGFFELLPDRLRALALALGDTDFDVDLNATKQPGNLTNNRVLTTRPVRRAEARFGLTMYPPELNVITAVEGREVALAGWEDVRWEAWAEVDARRRLHAYFWQHYRPSRRRSLRFAAARLLENWRKAR